MAYGKPKPFLAKKDEDFEIFESRMQDYFKLAKVADADKLVSLLLNLDGDARSAADILKVRDKAYADAITALKAYFVPPETRNERRILFNQRQQQETEGAPEFAQKLRIMASKAYPLFPAEVQEELTIQRFIFGLHHVETAQRIFMRQPKTLPEAVEMAKLSEAALLLKRRNVRPFESALSIAPSAPPQSTRKFASGNNWNNPSTSRNAWNAASSFAVAPSANQHSAGKKYYHKQNWNAGNNGTTSKPPVICWNCGQPGHIKSKCPQRPNPRNVSRSGAVCYVNQSYQAPAGRQNVAHMPFYGNSLRQSSSNQGQTGTFADANAVNTAPQRRQHALAILQSADEITEGSDELDQSDEMDGFTYMIQYACAASGAPGMHCADSLYAAGMLNDLNVNHILLDTGSTITLISTTLWNASCSPDNHLQPLSDGFVTANKSKLDVLGKTFMRIRIAGIDAIHSVIVVRDLAKHFILGSDFLKRHKCDILYSRAQLLSPQGVAEIHFNRSARDHTAYVCAVSTACAVLRPVVPEPANNKAEPNRTLLDELNSVMAVLPKTTTVSPNTQQLVQCTITGPKPMTKYLYAEPCMRTEQRSGVTIANALVNNTATVPIGVINLTRAPITIAAGTNMALLYRVTEEEEQPKGLNAAVMVDKKSNNSECMTAINEAAKAVTETHGKNVGQQFHTLLAQHQSLFSTNYHQLGAARDTYHVIDTGDALPIKQPPRRMPYQAIPELQTQVQQLLDAKIIRPSKSDWSSPIVFVRKKDGTWRLCIDYRRLNTVTRKDSFPLPDIRDLFDSLQGNCIFSTLDLFAGYYQIPVHPDSVAKTAFVTPTGLFEFLRMPFGVCNGPPTFQRMILTAFANMIGTKCLCYIDDIIVLGKSVTDHLENLKQVFHRLEKHNLRVKLVKCSFLQPSVAFLGHVISAQGLRTDPAKTAAVRTMPAPTDVNGVQQVLGLLNYYRTFIPDFAHIARPLTMLLEKDRPFEWSADCKAAFQLLKDRLCASPVLAFPRFDRSFILDTDASGFAISGVLSQCDDENKEHPVSYYSRTLSRPERNYSTTRRELLAVLDSLQHFRIYLVGHHFLLRTDHASIKWLTNFKDATGQNARWQERLAEFEYEIQHRPGRFHSNADTLSRLCADKVNVEEANAVDVEPAFLPPTLQTKLAQAQRDDKVIGIVYAWVQSGQRPANHEAGHLSRELRVYWAKFNLLLRDRQILYLKQFDETTETYASKAIVPASLHLDVVRAMHAQPGAGGHFSAKKTIAKVTARFFWIGLQQDVTTIVRACETCAKRKTARPNRATLVPIKCGYPFERVYMDMIGPLPLTARGNRYILTMIDGYSKWAEAIPSPSVSATVTARLIVNGWIAQHGAPTILHSDLGSNFTSRVVKEICAIFDIAQTHTTAYHPAGNGAVERFNRVLIDLIATGVEKALDNWDLYLNLLLMAHRSTVTTHGYTPFFILHGFEMKVPLDLQYGLSPNCPIGTKRELVQAYHASINNAYQHAREHLDTAHRSQQSAYDRRARGTRYAAGDKVYVFTPVVKQGQFHKFSSYWNGPMNVIQRVTDVDYLVEDPATQKRRMVHFDRLKPAHQLPPVQQERTSDSEEEEVGHDEEEQIIVFPPVAPNNADNVKQAEAEETQQATEPQPPALQADVQY